MIVRGRGSASGASCDRPLCSSINAAPPPAVFKDTARMSTFIPGLPQVGSMLTLGATDRKMGLGTAGKLPLVQVHLLRILVIA